ncbi:MAG: CapA family protein [Chloroflexota bacterium]
MSDQSWNGAPGGSPGAQPGGGLTRRGLAGAAAVAAVAVAAPPRARAQRKTPVADALRGGYALAASPRLPLAGVGPGDPERILNGEVSDWRQVGSPLAEPIERLALAGAEAGSAGSAATYPDYASLAEALRERRGAVALVPLDQIDFRVQTLSVGGVDPLTSGEGIEPAMRIGTVGDIVPGRNVHRKMADYGDFSRPFRRIAPLLSGFDLTIANLEGNLSDAIPQPANPNTFSFVSNTAMLEGFRLAGIDAVTVANNHTVWNAPEENWGLQAFLDTLAALESAGMPWFGGGYDLAQARAPWITQVGRTSVAWLGIDGVTANYEVPPGQENGVVDFDAGATDDRPGTCPYYSPYFLADIAAAAAQAQVVIPYFHMGAEYIAVPPEWVTAGARSAIDAGAAMVITNHPHVIQGMEIYNGRPIVYSPGNFIIDQMWAVEVRSGYVLETLLRGDRIVGLRVHGTEIEDFHQPRRMTSGEQANLLDRFWASTDRLRSRG